MKILSFTLFTCFCFLISCNKSENTNLALPLAPRLKLITFSKDTITPLCATCVPVISQKAELFLYDNSDRIISRTLTTTILTNTPITIDTTIIYKYVYSGSLIASYSEEKNNTIINHVLDYDLQNRLIRDSIVNPQLTNNKVSYFEYFPNSIIQTNVFSDAVVASISIDTMLLSGNNITREIIQTTTSSGTINYREINYTLSLNQNPLSYVNNFSLLSSDYKNGSGFYSFLIYSPQNITHSIVSQVTTKYWSNTSGVTQYSTNFSSSLDSLGRVQFFKDITNNRQSIYEYY